MDRLKPASQVGSIDHKDLIDFLECVTAATSIEAVWHQLTSCLSRFGFDRLIYGFTHFHTEHSLGDPDDLLILSNHDHRYLDRFLAERLYLTSPMMRWLAANTGACSWRWATDRQNELTEAELRVMAFNRQMGVTAGYSISFPALSQRSRGLLSLTARAGVTQDEIDAVWAEHGRVLHQKAIVAHLKFTTLPHSGARRPLTERQREALEWVGDGKTTQDIAVLMQLTPATVEKHLRLARKTLDVETTAQAVLKASLQNQIFVMRTPRPGPADDRSGPVWIP